MKTVEGIKMPKVVRVRPLSGYRLDIAFDDGTTGEIDLTDSLRRRLFEPLKDEKMFREVAIDEFGAIVWPCGADLAPDGVHRRLMAAATS
jgi:hypothetical protein